MLRMNWKLALRAGVLMAVCGVLVGGVVLIAFADLITASVPAGWFVPGAGLGAGLAGVLTCGMWGRDGVWGATLMVLGR